MRFNLWEMSSRCFPHKLWLDCCRGRSRYTYSWGRGGLNYIGWMKGCLYSRTSSEIGISLCFAWYICPHFQTWILFLWHWKWCLGRCWRLRRYPRYLLRFWMGIWRNACRGNSWIVWCFGRVFPHLWTQNIPCQWLFDSDSSISRSCPPSPPPFKLVRVG